MIVKDDDGGGNRRIRTMDSTKQVSREGANVETKASEYHPDVTIM